MQPPPSLKQRRPQPGPTLWEPTISPRGGAGLPSWESFPVLERRRLIDVLVRTARRHVPSAPDAPAESGGEVSSS
jgi:hypothetical protein